MLLSEELSFILFLKIIALLTKHATEPKSCKKDDQMPQTDTRSLCT